MQYIDIQRLPRLFSSHFTNALTHELDDEFIYALFYLCQLHTRYGLSLKECEEQVMQGLAEVYREESRQGPALPDRQRAQMRQAERLTAALRAAFPV